MRHCRMEKGYFVTTFLVPVKNHKIGGKSHGTRVVQRSNNNANTNGGLVYVNANNDSSNTNANIGSRLANR